MLNRAQVPVELEALLSTLDSAPQTLICFSHLRWNFVFQRPQHLMCRFAREMNVIFWEEPVEIGSKQTAYLQIRKAGDCPNVRIVVPHLPQGLADEAREGALKRLLDAHMSPLTGALIAWYYTPMMLSFSRALDADVTVYDAMDELSKFRFAPVKLLELEAELLSKADIVFTGGSSLYEAKKDRHPSVHCFPSSVDRAHFAKARVRQFDPADQDELRHPRLGFYGVIDERFDTELLAGIADKQPNWSFVMVGPVVKIAPEDLPQRPNIHYLGPKTYAELPAYLSGWDVALMPFAMNESTQCISPTKTPEYLAGGKPVVSTPIRDVIRTYGDLEGVRIAADAESFAAECEIALALSANPHEWLAEADLMLSATSWDTTQARMAGLVAVLLGRRTARQSSALLVAE